MFAKSGEITAPCGVPTFVSDHSPSSDTPAFNHFWISRSILGSPTRLWSNCSRCPWSRLSKKPRISASRIQFTFFHTIPAVSASSAPRNQRGPRGAPSRPEPIRDTDEVLFVDRVEDRHHRLLDYFVLQGGDSQRTLPPVGFWYVDSS